MLIENIYTEIVTTKRLLRVYFHNYLKYHLYIIQLFNFSTLAMNIITILLHIYQINVGWSYVMNI